ncbi:MAG: hypothetical protein ACI4P3_03635 [Candidatus Spyradosoma sp.]
MGAKAFLPSFLRRPIFRGLIFAARRAHISKPRRGAKLFSVGQASDASAALRTPNKNKARYKCAIAGTPGGEDVHVFVVGRWNDARQKKTAKLKKVKESFLLGKRLSSRFLKSLKGNFL